MKIVIAGSFVVYEEMKDLAQKLKATLNAECTLPRFFKGYTNSFQIEELKRKFKDGLIKLTREDFQKIGEEENYFFEQIEKADIVLVYNKKKEEGEIGINAAVDVGYALGRNKRVIFLFEPQDAGIRALITYGKRNIEIVNPERIINRLKK